MQMNRKEFAGGLASLMVVAGARALPPKAFYGSTIKLGIGLKAFIADRIAVEARRFQIGERTAM